MNRIVLSLTTILLALLASGCVTTRVTNTERTALEMALLSQSAEKAIAAFTMPDLTGETVFLDDTQFEATDEQFQLSALRLALLRVGAREVPEAADATIQVRTRSGISGTDERAYLIGIPAIPIVIPGAGTVSTPELALYKRSSQRGHNKIGIYGVRKNGDLAFDLGTTTGSNHFTRYTYLILITYRKTDLSEPYGKPVPPPEAE